VPGSSYTSRSAFPPVQGDATQFRQVVMNLVINGGEALGDGPGTVTVKTGEMCC
jgi:nitrogen-specific signal transduction histidine kinase